SVGKLPGPDRNGPSVPLRQGRNDLGRLRLALQALLGRFTTEDMICWVPSFGMELATVARSLAATYEEDGDPLFKRQCLVFPRPKSGRVAPWWASRSVISAGGQARDPERRDRGRPGLVAGPDRRGT